MKTTFSFVATAVLALTVAGCSSDPQATARDHFEKGNAQFSKQKFPEALIEYRRAAQADPRLGPARLQLAITYATVGDGPAPSLRAVATSWMTEQVGRVLGGRYRLVAPIGTGSS